MVTNLRYHRYTHLERFRCETCDIEFETRLQLKDHDAEKHNVKKLIYFRCEKCRKPFRSRMSFNRHRVKAHGEKLRSEHRVCFLEVHLLCLMRTLSRSSSSFAVDEIKTRKWRLGFREK